jgi:hypothetical protein
MNVISPEQIELNPIEIDPRPCEWCGLTIDQHRMVDIGEGPEFFCDELETQIYLEAADLVRQWELADPRDRWKHTGEQPPATSDIPKSYPRPYSTPDSVIDAFFYVARQGDRHRLARWLADHPTDKAELFKLWKVKRC